LTLLNLYRQDPKNVGDLWSVPARFFPLEGLERDILSPQVIEKEVTLVIVGGGGLGRPGAFKEALDRLRRPDRHYRLVAWGVGADSVSVKNDILPGPVDMPGLLDFWHGFDLVGTRIFSPTGYPDGSFQWVPCASCMSPLLDDLRAKKPTEKLGVYNHLRHDLRPHIRRELTFSERLLARFHTSSNRGKRLEDKLRFLARFETIVTNSYHGVYWATLLNRRVVCVPFNGLFSFRHPPQYFQPWRFKMALETAQSYPDALEECRDANRDFHASVKQAGLGQPV
jgi:hypothetical protein